MITEILLIYFVVGLIVTRVVYNGLKTKPVFICESLALVFVITSALLWPKFFFRKTE